MARCAQSPYFLLLGRPSRFRNRPRAAWTTTRPKPRSYCSCGAGAGAVRPPTAAFEGGFGEGVVTAEKLASLDLSYQLPPVRDVTSPHGHSHLFAILVRAVH